MTGLVCNFRHFAKGGITHHSIQGLALLILQTEHQIVQIGVFRAPAVRIPGTEHGGSAHRHHLFLKNFSPFHQPHGHSVSFLRIFHLRGNGQGRCPFGRNGRIIDDAGRGGRRLQPDTLPDAADGRIPDAFGVGDLLAAGLLVVVRGIQHLHHQLLLALHQIRRNVKGERRIATGMGTHPLAIEPHFRAPVHGLEVEPDLLALPLAGHLEGGAVPQGILGRQALSNARKGRFHGKGNQDLSLRGRTFPLFGADGIVPKAVERLPERALQLRTGIFRQRV